MTRIFATLATHGISLPEYVQMLEDYGTYGVDYRGDHRAGAGRGAL